MARALAIAAVVPVVALCARRSAAPPPPGEPANPLARPPCRDDVPAGDRVACDRQWTVLLYMMADGADLTPSALWSLDQMEARPTDPAGSAASGRDADVVVELDVDRPPGIRRLRVVGGSSAFVALRSLDDYAAASGPRSPVIETIDEALAEAPPATAASRLADFLAWGIARFPARHHALILWGHGFGFRPAGTDGHWRDDETPRGGIAFDHSDHSVLDIPALREVMAQASAAYLGGRPFDLYLSDACSMQTLEVDAELAGVARYLAGTEARFTLLGLPYRLLLPRLNGSAPPSPPSPRCAPHDLACRFAAQLPELVRSGVGVASELYDGEAVTSDARDKLTYAVVDAGVVAGRVAPAMQRLGSALAGYLREPPDQDERKTMLRDLLAPHRASATRPPAVHAFPGGGRDVGALLLRLRSQVAAAADPASLSPAAAALLRAIDDTELALRAAVLATALGTGYSGPDHAGMLGVSVWLPVDAADLGRWNDWFAAARLHHTAGAAQEPDPWSEWLRVLFDD